MTPGIFGEKIDRLVSMHEAITCAQVALNALKVAKEALDLEIISLLNQMGTSTGGTPLASVTRTETVVPTVFDWDLLYEYLLETKQPFLLERRFSSRAFRELLAAGVDVPGVEPFTRVTLAFKSKAPK